MRLAIFAVFLCAITNAHAVELPKSTAKQKPAVKTETTVHVFKPKQLPPPELSSLKVPEGFEISHFATNLGNVRMLAVAPDGTVYATRREESDVLMLKVDSKGNALPPVRVASQPGLHGIAIHDGKAYLATVHEIFRADVKPDGTFGTLEMLIHNLPDGGQHHTRTVQIGPDNMMYIGVGSTCNECSETNPESATMLRASLDGKSRSVFSSGLRDTIGYGWQPQTGEFWGMDHGIDWFGDDTVPEELNKLEQGKHYGWPYFWADNKENTRLDPTGGVSRAEWLKKSVPMVMGYTSHAAPLQLSFYNSNAFPAEYSGDAFVSMRGSWNRKEPKGYEVIHIDFRDGKPVSITPFVTGFISSQGEHGRLAGNAIAKDGSLLFGDDRHGIIYRVRYTGKGALATPTSIPADVMKQQAAAGSGVPLAMMREEVKTSATLNVESSAFEKDGKIPALHSEYEQGTSFPLTWEGAPNTTKSYAIIMEDPDSKKTPNPVVHWVAWNIPADITSLRQGLPKQPGVKDIPAMRQGNNSLGKPGYYGPRPPEGDPAHHYHTQLFALDTTLDLPPTTTRDELLAAMKGHVVASGELVGLFQRPASPSKP